MTIGFNEIPTNLRVPFIYAEVDSSNAVQGPSLMPFRVLACGQMLAGIATPLVPVRITSKEQAATLFGAGSVLAQICASYIKNDSMTELWAMGVADDDAAVAATGTVAITGPATAAGTLCLYIGGRKAKAAVASGATASTVATALAAAVNALADCPVSASADSGTVTLTARHKGLLGNAIDLRLNYYGEETPAGLGVTLTAMHGGTTNPDAAPIIAALGDEQYHVIVWPWTDAESLTAIEEELASRWTALRMIEGMAVSAAVGSHGTLGTLGDSRNSKHLCLMHAHGVPSLPWELAGAVAAVMAYNGNIDPARPFQTLPLYGILPPAKADRFTLQENNLLLFDGISTFAVDSGGVVRVQRLITTYKTSPAGAEDPAYLDVCTPLTISYLRYDFRSMMLRDYPRHKLADDGKYGVGQPIMTPKHGKAVAIAWARQKEEQGLMENINAFAANLVVERNASDRNRLDFYLPTDLVNQFVVGAVQIGFIL